MTDQTLDPQQMLNEAIKFHQENRLLEAENNYLLLLEHLPQMPEINNLYALLLTQTERSLEAIPYLKVVSNAAPNEENLMRYAMICMKHNMTDEAIIAIDKMLEQQADHMQARLLQAHALQAKGKHHQALLKFNAILAERPDSPMILHHMGQCLHHYEVDNYSDETAEVFLNMMSHPDIQPQKLFHNAIALILKHDAISRYQKTPTPNIAETLENARKILNSQLFTLILDECLVINEVIEQLLSRLRSYFLASLSNPNNHKIISENANLICHMANQCFFNEYIYVTNDRVALPNISDLLGKPALKAEEFTKGLIGLRACYDALYETEICQQAKDFATAYNDPQLNNLVKAQITEPLLEAKFIRTIKSLSEITDKTSQKIQAQYEQSPYPRWKHYSQIVPRAFLDELSRQIPNINIEDITFTKTPDILIAGCSTGQHPITAARAIEGATITAIDLSKRSLSYAKRKAQEMNIDNINFMQADILDMEKLDKQFDVIESIGVIHHMKDPIGALAKLNDMLKPSGYMKIGLYSNAARKSFSLVRDKISKMGIADDMDSIRNFREFVFRQPINDPLSDITKAHDFYSLSTCRDLLFHSEEHPFTLSEIDKAIADLKLEFLGFNFPSMEQYKAFKRAYPIKGQENQLENWQAFEEKTPNFFGSMYVFWMQKQAD